MSLSKKEKKLVWDRIKNKKNVLGFSGTYKTRIKDGVEVPNTKVVRVYVQTKEEDTSIDAKDFIPAVIHIGDNNVEIDVVEIGEVKALVDKTSRYRPVKLGLSVGHWDITAGSLGVLYKKNGQIKPGSNAHVLTDDPSKEPNQITEKRICQPGPYHDTINKNNNIVGTYEFHDRIYPIGYNGDCQITRFVCWLFNGIASLLGRKSRIEYSLDIVNYQDWAVYNPTTEHLLEFADGSIDLSEEKFIGHLFAGGSTIGVICKVKYAIQEGYIPMADTCEPVVGDKVKGSSFWCNYQTEVIDESGIIQVNYGNFNALFNDVILVKNENVIKGGWSGSGWACVD